MSASFSREGSRYFFHAGSGCVMGVKDGKAVIFYSNKNTMWQVSQTSKGHLFHNLKKDGGCQRHMAIPHHRGCVTSPLDNGMNYLRTGDGFLLSIILNTFLCTSFYVFF